MICVNDKQPRLIVSFNSFFFFTSAEEPGNFHSIIVNDDLEIAYNEFKDTISKVK